MTILPLEEPFYLDIANRRCGRISSSVDGTILGLLLHSPPLRTEALQVVREHLAALGDSAEAILPPDRRVSLVETKPAVNLNLYRQELIFVPARARKSTKKGLKSSIPFFEWTLTYGSTKVKPLLKSSTTKNAVRESTPEGEAVYLRDDQTELTVIQALAKNGFVIAKRAYTELPSRNSSDFVFSFSESDLEPASMLEIYCKVLADVVPTLRKRGWNVTVEEDLSIIPIENVDWEISTKPDGIHWFDLDLGVVVEGARYEMLPLVIGALASPAFQNAMAVASVPDEA